MGGIHAGPLKQPLKDPSALLQPKEETVVEVKGAQVVLADYDLLRTDFPQLKPLSEAEIDSWLIHNTAYVSRAQAAQTVVNTKVRTGEGTRRAFRPMNYKRALVYEVSDPAEYSETIGLIDVKGTGSLEPKAGSHSNGLATLGESVRELLYENLVREVLADSSAEVGTVGSYAVIDLGFDVRHEDASTSRAGLYLRQAHERNKYDMKAGEDERYFVELFRKYGLNAEKNVQASKSGDILDFGHYTVVRELPQNGFPNKRVPFDLWGIDESVPEKSEKGWFYSKYERPWY